MVYRIWTTTARYQSNPSFPDTFLLEEEEENEKRRKIIQRSKLELYFIQLSLKVSTFYNLLHNVNV